jgi:ssDNA-binding Zn-finger/Zn-ribbon topoisomerase 1
LNVLYVLLMRLLQSCRAPNCGWVTHLKKSRIKTPQCHPTVATVLTGLGSASNEHLAVIVPLNHS